MTAAIDAAELDMELRHAAETAAAELSQRLSAAPALGAALPTALGATPPTEAENEEDAVRPAEDGARFAAADALAAPALVEPPRYHPVSPFRLVFAFGSDGTVSGVEMKDPVFAWQDGDTVEMKTATVGSIEPSGTVYLNVSLDSKGVYQSAEVAMSASGSMSVPLYELDAAKGAVKDYRHALIVLGRGGTGGGGGGLEDEVEFVADIDWYVNGSVHQLRKRLRVLDLATGKVSDKAGTTYANGWEVAANTTPISSIIGS